MEITKQEVYNMIDRYIQEIGLTKEQTYNPKTNAYYWIRGSAPIEVFVQEIPVSNGTRNYLRIFSYLGNVPDFNLQTLLRHLLELNDENLGVKLTIMPGTEKIYATYERDIEGLDYEELATFIADLEWWADKLDDELQNQFGVKRS
ncbi:MAG: hypothetical protein KatS3mg129_1514 [Leptospiraceae bacterium]|nr:MAG: hypothetical protein KatS3mg129_1514 [Leptospiraceae bacterium]